jgi:hypothetical protein
MHIQASGVIYDLPDFVSNPVSDGPSLQIASPRKQKELNSKDLNTSTSGHMLA